MCNNVKDNDRMIDNDRRMMMLPGLTCLELQTRD